MAHSDHVTSADDKEGTAQTMRAFLECLTGPSRGMLHWLAADRAAVRLDETMCLTIEEARPGAETSACMAVLIWVADGYVIEATGDRPLWVNGRAVTSAGLRHGDTIEFGDLGPLARFRLCERSFPSFWGVNDILGDVLAYARSSRRPWPARLRVAAREGARRLVWQTTVLFRVTVTLALIGMAVLGLRLYQSDQSLRERLEQDARRIEAVTLLLAQTRQEALSDADLAALQDRLEARLSQNAERLVELEHRSEATAKVIRAAAPATAFVQGAFGLRHIDSGNMLRQVLDADGTPRQTPFGQPMIEPLGTGPPAEFQFTGTGFLLEDGQRLVTNRHVALPWTSGDRMPAFEAAGLKPEMLRLLAYLPDRPGPIEARLVGHSEAADLAVLTLAPERLQGRGLPLATGPATPGDEVVLLGYPTGLKSLLAQAGRPFLAALKEGQAPDFWTVAARLSEAGLINPLASRGIVAQANPGAVLYDAETAVGGSGGPALNRQGAVVAVNAAILPEFGGSNIGVPVDHLVQLLRQIEADAQ